MRVTPLQGRGLEEGGRRDEDSVATPCLTNFDAENHPEIPKAPRMPCGKFYRGLLNLVVLLVIGAVILVLNEVVEPYQRGFFCNDESLSYPYHSSTISSLLLYLVGLLVPLVVVVIVEVSLREDKRMSEIPLGRYLLHVPTYLVSMYSAYTGFLLGAGFSQVLTDMSKVSVGRLRPHFFDVCNPDFSELDCGTEQEPVYVTNYTCPGNSDLFPGDQAELLHRIEDSHMSFPSGHASFSSTSMAFLVLYLQARLVPVTGKNFLVQLMQLCAVAFAIFTSISRVSDYKHHPGDVIGGAILGAMAQVLNVVYVQKMFDRALPPRPGGLDEEMGDFAHPVMNNGRRSYTITTSGGQRQ